MLASHARMHSIHKLFGHRVRQLREEQQLGAADVAALIGCDVSHYYSIERGAHPPSFALLLAIAKTFKVDEADLFTWPGSGLRHDVREQVRLATPPALAALKAALANVGAGIAGVAVGAGVVIGAGAATGTSVSSGRANAATGTSVSSGRGARRAGARQRARQPRRRRRRGERRPSRPTPTAATSRRHASRAAARDASRACGVRRAACGVRPAACGVRRAACGRRRAAGEQPTTRAAERSRQAGGGERERAVPPQRHGAPRLRQAATARHRRTDLDVDPAFAAWALASPIID